MILFSLYPSDHWFALPVTDLTTGNLCYYHFSCVCSGKIGFNVSPFIENVFIAVLWIWNSQVAWWLWHLGKRGNSVFSWYYVMYEQKLVQVFSWIKSNPPNNSPSPPLHMACCHPHDPQLCGPRMIWPPELWGMWLRRNLLRRQAAVDNFCGGEEAEQPDGGWRMPRRRKTWWPPPVNCGGRNAGEEEKAPTPAGNPHSYCTFFSSHRHKVYTDLILRFWWY